MGNPFENALLIHVANLENYHCVVFLNPSGAILDSRQKNDF